jgi:hypothetical protein
LDISTTAPLLSAEARAAAGNVKLRTLSDISQAPFSEPEMSCW